MGMLKAGLSHERHQLYGNQSKKKHNVDVPKVEPRAP